MVLVMIQILTDQLMAQDDNLKPVNGIFSIYDFQFDYYSSVRKILFKGLSDDPEIRIVVIPSFSPESVLDIEKDKQSERYFLLYHKANPSIWYSHGKKKVNVDTIRNEIESNSFLLLKKLLESAIFKAKYQLDSLGSIGTDGTDYYFSVSNIWQKGGTTWSPRDGSKMGKLVDIVNHLIQLMKAESGEIEFDSTFSKEVTNLTNSLK